MGFVQILGEIQENIIDRLELLEENLYTFFQQKCFSNVQDGVSQKVFFNEEIERYKKILNVELPINELKKFIKFDESLADDKEKLDAFVS